LREQLDGRCRDHAKRALGANEQVLEVVAGIVLAQSAQALPHLAAGQNDFEAKRQLACIAVAQHLGAAGIGRQVAAERGAALGGEAQREEPTLRGGSLLHRLQQAAGLRGQRVVGGVDRTNTIHPTQADDDVAAGRRGRRATHEARIAALRHDRCARRRARAYRRCNLGRRGRQYDCGCAADIASSPVGQVGGHVVL
jgi:hypothetical protein